MSYRRGMPTGSFNSLSPLQPEPWRLGAKDDRADCGNGDSEA